MNQPGVQNFLRRVGQRKRVVNFARQGRAFVLIALGVYLLALLLSRLLGVLPGWFSPVSLAAWLAGVLLAALIFHRRPAHGEAARLVDAHLGTLDLFLTASQIEHSLGDYQELVLRQAETRAADVPPQKVVPYAWQRDTVRVAGVVAVLVLGIYFLPQFDPFKIHQRQKQVAEQHERVRELNKATQARAALLEQKRSGEQTDVTKQALANLEKVLLAAKPNDKAGTLTKLNEQQKALGQLWRQANEEKLKNALNLPPTAQSFGLADPQKAQQLRNDLQKGDVSSARKELDELKQKAEELAQAKDPMEREKLRQELMDRLQNLKDTLGQQTSSQAVDSDLQRAMEQLAMCNSPGLSGEALKGMSDSLRLTQEELQQLAKAMADMKSLEEALKALQMAKALHGLQPLDGKDFAQFGDLSAYASFCQGKCQSLCPIPGMGMGPGQGIGPRPYGDDNDKTDFHPEKSPSQLQPGKMLMEWKTREVSEAGPAREEYLRAVADVRQQASEAIVSEQIPPGYQAAIKKYFDTLHNDTRANAQP
ncbi:MAG TPA: hypothetical protein VF988_12315 [Verrucomicrobiae bacterium]